MSTTDWLGLLTLAAICGVTGQLARFLIALPRGGSPLDRWAVVQCFAVAVSVGAIAGILAALSNTIDIHDVTHQNVVALVTAGYVGTDAIEQSLARVVHRSNGKQHPS
jgi:hypothetical protein